MTKLKPQKLQKRKKYTPLELIQNALIRAVKNAKSVKQVQESIDSQIKALSYYSTHRRKLFSNFYMKFDEENNQLTGYFSLKRKKKPTQEIIISGLTRTIAMSKNNISIVEGIIIIPKKMGKKIAKERRENIEKSLKEGKTLEEAIKNAPYGALIFLNHIIL